jgi:hypothetical protein
MKSLLLIIKFNKHMILKIYMYKLVIILKNSINFILIKYIIIMWEDIM